MSYRSVLRGFVLTASAYFVALMLVMILMSAYVTGDPQIDGRDTNLPLLNLLAKLALAFATGFMAGYCFSRYAWLAGALAMLAILVTAAVLPESFFVFAFFKGDDLLFCAVYVFVGAVAGHLGRAIAKVKHSKGQGST